MNDKFILFLTCVAFCCFSCRSKNDSSGATTGSSVIATSSWTAAYAQVAGADNIIILAPVEMSHPSEYELRPSDIPKLMGATVIVYAGYEIMSEQLKKGLNLPPEKLLLIQTEYSYETIEKAVMELAVRLGTENIARENLLEIRRVFDDGRKAVVEKNELGLRVAVHHFHVPLAKELGLDPVVIFGPAVPELSEIVSVSRTEVTMLLDNFHNPVGQSLKEILPNARYKQLLNFPGSQGTHTLSDVIRYNVSQIVSD